MIYCNLKGGLCNMLFQIAATKSFSIDKGIECSFPNLINQYHLMDSDDYYNPSLKHSFEYQDMFGHLNTTSPTGPLPYITYPFEFKNLETPNDDYIIDGFFQTEKYFAHNREQILDFVKISDGVMGKIKNKYSNLLNQRTTAIHVRRGDYLRFPNHHPTQSLEYYNNAISILADKTDVFLVFSDDIDWCKANLKLDNIVYIEKEKDYIDLYLMSLCDNAIMSNSSFSWWGAWLNQNENKIIVGPKIWFGPAIQHNTSDVLSDNWIKL